MRVERLRNHAVRTFDLPRQVNIARAGLFDGVTGAALDYKTLTPEEPGEQIGPVTYLAIPEDR